MWLSISQNHTSHMNKILFAVLLPLFFACNNPKRIGSIERIDPSLDSIILPGREPEIIADGYTWTEGPLWIEGKKMLLFSDVFSNKVYQWTEEKGAEVYLTPSGYTGTTTRKGELGSNGLLLNSANKLVLCQHGNRQVAVMESNLDQPKPVYRSLAAQFDGKKLNSPNDATFRSNGDLYFTDPPYGLEGRMTDPLKELQWQGVYRAKPTGEVILLCDSISRPNGIAFFPGEHRLLVANSDSSKPFWYAFDVINDSLRNGRILYSASSALGEGKGLPDGLKIDKNGRVFATGPGGVFIFNGDGKLLGKIKLPVAPSNCAFSDDQKTLYITATNYVLKLRMRN
jgi:gluconolactonase